MTSSANNQIRHDNGQYGGLIRPAGETTLSLPSMAPQVELRVSEVAAGTGDLVPARGLETEFVNAYRKRPEAKVLRRWAENVDDPYRFGDDPGPVAYMSKEGRKALADLIRTVWRRHEAANPSPGPGVIDLSRVKPKDGLQRMFFSDYVEDVEHGGDLIAQWEHGLNHAEDTDPDSIFRKIPEEDRAALANFVRRVKKQHEAGQLYPLNLDRWKPGADPGVDQIVVNELNGVTYDEFADVYGYVPGADENQDRAVVNLIEAHRQLFKALPAPKLVGGPA